MDRSGALQESKMRVGNHSWLLLLADTCCWTSLRMRKLRSECTKLSMKEAQHGGNFPGQLNASRCSATRLQLKLVYTHTRTLSAVIAIHHYEIYHCVCACVCVCDAPNPVLDNSNSSCQCLFHPALALPLSWLPQLNCQGRVRKPTKVYGNPKRRRRSKEAHISGNKRNKIELITRRDNVKID